jgi:class 3 adenylate cyclase
VRSTNLVEALGDDAWHDLERWHDTMIRSLVGASGGSVVSGLGDGFFIAFDDGAQAIGAAISIQRALRDHRRQHGFAPQVRIGIHQAEATVVGDNYSGGAVHMAARIGALADGGQILVSSETAALAGAGVAHSVPDTVTLKGFAVPVEVVRIDWEARDQPS